MRTVSWLIGTAAVLAVAAGAAAQSLDKDKLTQPQGAEYPGADDTAMVAKGEKLFDDPSIGESGLACSNCHQDFARYKDTFKQPYPHFVAMAKGKAGMDEVTAAEMVQLCMVVPMQAEPLPWDSDTLAALTAYVKDERQRFAAQ